MDARELKRGIYYYECKHCPEVLVLYVDNEKSEWVRFKVALSCKMYASLDSDQGRRGITISRYRWAQWVSTPNGPELKHGVTITNEGFVPFDDFLTAKEYEPGRKSGRTRPYFRVTENWDGGTFGELFTAKELTKILTKYPTKRWPKVERVRAYVDTLYFCFGARFGEIKRA